MMVDIKTEEYCDEVVERPRVLINKYIERKVMFNYKVSARVTVDIES